MQARNAGAQPPAHNPVRTTLRTTLAHNPAHNPVRTTPAHNPRVVRTRLFFSVNYSISNKQDIFLVHSSRRGLRAGFCIVRQANYKSLYKTMHAYTDLHAQTVIPVNLIRANLFDPT